MAFSGSGAVWEMEPGAFIAQNVPGLQAEYDAKKALITEGIFYVGPGLEGLVLGAFPPNLSLMLVTKTGIVGYSNFHVLDAADPTKRLRFDASAIGAGITRVATIPNWSGYLMLPPDLGVLGQFLKSNGPGAQPTWAAGGGINAMLDGVNHTDTVAQAVARGALMFGNPTPKWDRLPAGALNTLLKSDGVDPSWGTVALLSGFHSDTLGAAPVRGDLIVANATPAWARFAKGAADTFLGSDGTDLVWRTAAALAGIIAPVLEHTSLARLRPISAPNCTWNNGSTNISTSGGAFANVKVGDFIVTGGSATPGNIGRRVQTWNNSNSIEADSANTGTSLSGVALVFIPGDHWDDTIAQDSNGVGCGVLLSRGKGNYSATGPGTTFQEIRGPLRWMGDANGSVNTDFQVQGSTSLASPFGFRIFKTVAIMATLYVNDLSASRSYRLPNIGDGTFIMDTGAQDVASKKFTTGNKIMVDGTATRSVFTDPAEVDKLAFDVSGPTTLRTASWQDKNGTVAYVGDSPIASYGPGSFTLANGQYLNVVKQLRLTGTQRATLQGDSRLVIAN